MKKIITLFIIGIIGIILFLTVKKVLTGDGAITLVCKNTNDTITLKFDPTSEKAISATHKDGSDFEIKDIDEKIKKGRHRNNICYPFFGAGICGM